MTEFQTFNITDTLTDFLKTCPFLSDYGVDLSDIGVAPITAETGDVSGSAIDYNGSAVTASQTDVYGNRRVTRQANFQLMLYLQSPDSVTRRETVEFLFNFERWVDYCDHYRLAPDFMQSVSATNGMVVSADETGRSSYYAVQIHVTYQEHYPSPSGGN